MKSLPKRFKQAVVVYANFAQFAPGQVYHFPWVASRMILWCKAGTGTMVVNGRKVQFEAGQYLLLPWAHNIRYEASQEDPFLLAGLHVIPFHHPKHCVTFEVAYEKRHPLANATFRRDEKIPGWEGLQEGRISAESPLGYFMEYIVRLFERHPPAERVARELAQRLLEELQDREKGGEAREHSPGWERLREYVLFHLHQPLTLRDLAEFSGWSYSTVGRMVRQNTGVSAVRWISQLKMKRAQVLLRTRRFSVAEVGRQVGVTDPYYFSRCFKKTTGASPLAYRQKTLWI